MSSHTTNIHMLNTPLTRQLTGSQLEEQGIRVAPRRSKTRAEAPVRFIPRQPENELPDLIA